MQIPEMAVVAMPLDLSKLDLPDEVSVADATRILGVNKKTVIAYIRGGVLPARNVASPTSSRPQWRIPLDAVVEMRTAYEQLESRVTRHLRVSRSAGADDYQSEHITMKPM